MEKPSKQEWEQLYEAASQFKESLCWTWMYDGDIFAVEDPETGQVAYCSIMGNAGQLVGIAAYLGPEGLLNLTELLLFDNDHDEFRYKQKCLMLSYGDRGDLEAQDLKVIKDIGLKFRGRGQWPQFQDFSPGKLPWFLQGPQCRFLGQIIRQAVAVATRCKNNKDLLTNYPEELKMLVRVLDRKKGTWKDEYREARAMASYLSLAIRDELLLRKLHKFRGRPGGVLEVETFYCPTPVVEKKGERPFFPRMCTFVDHHSGMVLGYKNFTDLAEEGHQCLDGLIATITKLGAIPSQILVRKDESFYLFKDVCQQLGIELVQVEKLEFTQEVKAGLFEFMG